VTEKTAGLYFVLELGLTALLVWVEVETQLCCVHVRLLPKFSRWSQQADLKSGVSPR
jgi:hypothetical protein